VQNISPAHFKSFFWKPSGSPPETKTLKAEQTPLNLALTPNILASSTRSTIIKTNKFNPFYLLLYQNAT